MRLSARQACHSTNAGTREPIRHIKSDGKRLQERVSQPLAEDQLVVTKMPLTQLIAPGFDGMPVSSGTTVKKLNLIAGLL
jgi:hypothetical protein